MSAAEPRSINYLTLGPTPLALRDRGDGTFMTTRERLADLLTGGALTRARRERDQARADRGHHQRAHSVVGSRLACERLNRAAIKVDRDRLKSRLAAVDELLDAEQIPTPDAGTTVARVHAALEAARQPRRDIDTVNLAGAVLERFMPTTAQPDSPGGLMRATCTRHEHYEWCSQLNALSRGTTDPGPLTSTDSDATGPAGGTPTTPRTQNGAEDAS